MCRSCRGVQARSRPALLDALAAQVVAGEGPQRPPSRRDEDGSKEDDHSEEIPAVVSVACFAGQVEGSRGHEGPPDNPAGPGPAHQAADAEPDPACRHVSPPVPQAPRKMLWPVLDAEVAFELGYALVPFGDLRCEGDGVSGVDGLVEASPDSADGEDDWPEEEDADGLPADAFPLEILAVPLLACPGPRYGDLVHGDLPADDQIDHQRYCGRQPVDHHSPPIPQAPQ